MEEKNTLTIIDDEGTEKEFEILFTFDYEVTKKKYVVVQDLKDPDAIYGFSYTEDGELTTLEEDEVEIIEEVLDAWQSENEIHAARIEA